MVTLNSYSSNYVKSFVAIFLSLNFKKIFPPKAMKKLHFLSINFRMIFFFILKLLKNIYYKKEKKLFIIFTPDLFKKLFFFFFFLKKHFQWLKNKEEKF